MKKLFFTNYDGFELEQHNECITHLGEGWSCQQKPLGAILQNTVKIQGFPSGKLHMETHVFSYDSLSPWNLTNEL